jgi:hypothetical protein
MGIGFLMCGLSVKICALGLSGKNFPPTNLVKKLAFLEDEFKAVICRKK